MFELRLNFYKNYALEAVAPVFSYFSEYYWQTNNCNCCSTMSAIPVWNQYAAALE